MHIDMLLQWDINKFKNEISVKDFINILLVKQTN